MWSPVCVRDVLREIEQVPVLLYADEHVDQAALGVTHDCSTPRIQQYVYHRIVMASMHVYGRHVTKFNGPKNSLSALPAAGRFRAVC